MCSSFFFLFAPSIKTGHTTFSGNRFAEYNLHLSTPSRAVTRVRHVKTFVAYLPQQINFFIQRLLFVSLLYLDFNRCKMSHFVSNNCEIFKKILT